MKLAFKFLKILVFFIFFEKFYPKKAFFMKSIFTKKQKFVKICPIRINGSLKIMAMSQF